VLIRESFLEPRPERILPRGPEGHKEASGVYAGGPTSRSATDEPRGLRTHIFVIADDSSAAEGDGAVAACGDVGFVRLHDDGPPARTGGGRGKRMESLLHARERGDRKAVAQTTAQRRAPPLPDAPSSGAERNDVKFAGK